MKTAREFEHDDSHFEIQTSLSEGFWKVRVLCNKAIIGDTAVFSDEIVSSGREQGMDIINEAINEMERLVRSIYDLRVNK